MQTIDAYPLLVRKLEAMRTRPWEELRALVGQPPVSLQHRVGDEDVSIEIDVQWVDKAQRSLRIHGSARGPSSWRLQILQESLIVDSPMATDA